MFEFKSFILYIGHRHAVGECIFAYRGITLDDYLFQADASPEGLEADVRHAGGDSDTLQVDTICESIVADVCYAGRDGETRQACTVLEG